MISESMEVGKLIKIDHGHYHLRQQIKQNLMIRRIKNLSEKTEIVNVTEHHLSMVSKYMRVISVKTRVLFTAEDVY